MLIGFDLYLFYGMKNSFLNKGSFDSGSFRFVSLSGIGMVLALVAVAFIHHEDASDNVLFYFSLIFSALHALLYAFTYNKTQIVK